MGSYRRWPRLASACLAMLALGPIYGWSVFSAPIQQEFQWDATTLSFTFTLLMWMFCAGGVSGAKLARQTSVRFVLFVSAALILLSFVLTVLTVSSDAPWMLYLTYGVLCGGSVGMSYAVIMSTIVAWYPDNSGAVSGVMLFCYSVSTLLLSSVAVYLFNAIGWRLAFIVIGAGVSFCVLLSAFFLRKPTSEESDAVAARRNTIMRKKKASCAARSGFVSSSRENLAPKQMLGRPVFYIYACWMLLVSCIGLGALGASNHLALASGAAVSLAVGLVGLLSVCNGCGRIVNGIIVDRIGTAKAMALVSTLLTIGCVFMLLGLAIMSVVFATIGIVVLGLGIGGTSVIGSNFLTTSFGIEHYAENLSILNLILIPAALLGPIAISVSVEQTGDYTPGVLVLVVLGIVSLLCSAVIARIKGSA